MGFCVFENLKSHRKVKNFVIFRTPLNHICDFKSTSDLKSCDFQNMPECLYNAKTENANTGNFPFNSIVKTYIHILQSFLLILIHKFKKKNTYKTYK